MSNSYLKIAISLIKYHFENNEIMFKAKCNELIKALFENGKTDLAEYIEAQTYPEHTFSVQEVKKNEQVYF